MNDPRRPAQYPPPVQRWRFSEPPVRPRWFWIAVIAGPLATLALVGAFVAVIALDSQDAPGIIDDAEALEVVSRECELMTSTVVGLPLAGTPSERASKLRAQNAAVEQMLDGIRALDEKVLERDAPLLEWLDDWTLLLQAREEYASAVASGDDASLDIPTDEHGDEITDRMDGAGMLACEVPPALVEPVFADTRGA
ncbi:hypothetical protein [Aeromicrobium sp. CTD01-1L150]|uniref:hypothetical protein n=1 Tax=Aeromicrobium sp. CTD01-1L150 TaxID=3341830 RepID=UPI0035C216E4